MTGEKSWAYIEKMVLDLYAVIGEYEHALEHIRDCATCPFCETSAASALEGVNHDDFFAAANDTLNDTPYVEPEYDEEEDEDD